MLWHTIERLTQTIAGATHLVLHHRPIHVNILHISTSDCYSYILGSDLEKRCQLSQLLWEVKSR